MAPTVQALRLLGESATVEKLTENITGLMALPEDVVAYRRDGAGKTEVPYCGRMGEDLPEARRHSGTYGARGVGADTTCREITDDELSVPFALVGGVWLMFLMGFNMSVAVAVGFIALAGVSAETGVIMLIYLDHALSEARAACRSAGRTFTRGDLRAAVMAGAVERVRPKMMTVTAIMAGLLPIL